RPTYLPFRRISLPTAPNRHRDSVVSVSSFDSLPEEGPSMPVVPRNGGRKSRPGSMDLNGLQNRRIRRTVKTDGRQAKRRKIIQEFYETERAYVEGLELIYEHFLTPIVNSLETSTPLLDRAALTSVFSNFIDIWNFHRNFLVSLTEHLFPAPTSTLQADLPLAPSLLSHFPYLSLYTPFITTFPNTVNSITNIITPDNPTGQYNATFANWVKEQEADPRCGKLKLRDWLLTVVQRCPRYLLLLKDLIDCTSPDDPEHAQLMAVHTLVSKITQSLNSSLHSHAQVLSLLALQKATPNLPFQLISPGRTLLKRDALYQKERSEPHREREFLLFSDCLIWLASEESERSWMNIGHWANGNEPASPFKRPLMVRARSKSEAELPTIQKRPPGPSRTRSVIPPPRVSGIKRNQSTQSVDEKWTFKGRAGLVDLEVVVPPPRELGDERRFEILSPGGSFVVLADTEEERDEWCSSIRQAKAQLLMSLNLTHPNSTLTSSDSNKHVRLSLQALPFAPDEKKGKKLKAKERRGWVDHWVPAIWIPDEKAEVCMRCAKSFGWRRRRHHCRLCGRCVCASCSEMTFFISDANNITESTKPARACNACYETVFPLLDPEDEAMIASESGTGTIGSLRSLPFHTSMPCLSLGNGPQALMAIDAQQPRSPPPRPRSYVSILEDFQEHEEQPQIDSVTEEDAATTTDETLSLASSKRHTVDLSENAPSPKRREDTVRRNKRFSMPAVALQPTSVTTRSGLVSHGREGVGHNNIIGFSRSKRLSLVLGGGAKGHTHARRFPTSLDDERGGLGNGAAAEKLSGLLGRRQSMDSSGIVG
ncbi:hypothetical protein CYLTODRAFT_360395, partial [Cylindrobasidium torrendii FP15055 ss-10]